MGIFNKITRKIAGVEKSRDASPDSDAREILNQAALIEEDPIVQDRYFQCAGCDHLKEEFKLLGITIKDMTPTCGECGCNLLLKIPMKDMNCPLLRWNDDCY